jgi:hypothetical protein
MAASPDTEESMRVRREVVPTRLTDETIRRLDAIVAVQEERAAKLNLGVEVTRASALRGIIDAGLTVVERELGLAEKKASKR